MELKEALLKRRSVRKFMKKPVTGEMIRELLGIPSTQIPFNVIFIGHPAEEPEARDQYDETKIHYVR